MWETRLMSGSHQQRETTTAGSNVDCAMLRHMGGVLYKAWFRAVVFAQRSAVHAVLIVACYAMQNSSIWLSW